MNKNKDKSSNGNKMDREMEQEIINAKYRVKANHKKIIGLGKLPKLDKKV